MKRESHCLKILEKLTVDTIKDLGGNEDTGVVPFGVFSKVGVQLKNI